MSRIDESRRFIALNIAILTVSDTRTLEDDRSGDTLVGRLEGRARVGGSGDRHRR
jgi:molybdenum cofactor biosynthesis protein B